MSQGLFIWKRVSPNMSRIHKCRFVGDDLSEKESKRSNGRVPSRTPPNTFAGFVYILLEHDGTVM